MTTLTVFLFVLKFIIPSVLPLLVTVLLPLSVFSLQTLWTLPQLIFRQVRLIGRAFIFTYLFSNISYVFFQIIIIHLFLLLLRVFSLPSISQLKPISSHLRVVKCILCKWVCICPFIDWFSFILVLGTYYCSVGIGHFYMWW